MTPAKAILTGAAVIAASIVATGGFPRAEAQRASSGPFQLMHHSNANANAGVFRLDTSTGEVSYCFLSGAAGMEQSRLTCSKPVQ